LKDHLFVFLHLDAGRSSIAVERNLELIRQLNLLWAGVLHLLQACQTLQTKR